MRWRPTPRPLRLYAYVSKWRVRHAYRFSVESSVYLAPQAARQGLGTALYTALLAQLQERGYHLVIGGVALPNEASVALHEKKGDRPRFPGQRENVVCPPFFRDPSKKKARCQKERAESNVQRTVGGDRSNIGSFMLRCNTVELRCRNG